MARIYTLMITEHTIDNQSITVSKDLNNIYNKGSINKCKIIYNINLEKDNINQWYNLNLVYNGRIQYIENGIFGYVERYWQFYDQLITLTNVAPVRDYYSIIPKIAFHSMVIRAININDINQLEILFDYNITIDDVLEEGIIDVALVQKNKS